MLPRLPTQPMLVFCLAAGAALAPAASTLHSNIAIEDPYSDPKAVGNFFDLGSFDTQKLARPAGQGGEGLLTLAGKPEEHRQNMPQFISQDVAKYQSVKN